MNRLRSQSAPALALWAAFFGCVLLQIWRPFYFLGDDNLVAWYPVALESGQRLWSGQTPFQSAYLFGGHYDLLRDPGALCLWNPVWLAFSPLSLTPAKLALADLHASSHLLLSAWAMAHLLARLRALQNLEISDRRIAFLAVSYAFSGWAIITGAAWFTFLANQASLPIIFLGWLDSSRRRGISIVTGGLLYGLLAGHINSFLLSIVFLSLFLAVQWAQNRDGEPIRRWFWGGIIALVIASPLLFFAWQGFGGMARNRALVPEMAAQFAVPLPVLIGSFFGGIFAAAGQYQIVFLVFGTSSAIASCAAAWAIFDSWGARRKFRNWEISCLVAAAIVGLFVVRPSWLTLILSYLPVLRSTRLPFREVFALLFFLHLFIALRPVALKPRLRYATWSVGIAIFLMSFAVLPPPYFTPFPLDRQLILSGQYQNHWRKVRALMGPNASFVPVLARDIPFEDVPKVPWILLGAYNYAALVEVPSQTGYVLRGMNGQVLHGAQARPILGTFLEKDIAVLHQADPNLRFLILESVEPLKIAWSDGEKRVVLVP